MSNDTLMTASDIDKAITRISKNILDQTNSFENVCFVGIRTRGIVVAERILEELKKNRVTDIPLGTLDITLYRDDLRTTDTWPVIERTDID